MSAGHRAMAGWVLQSLSAEAMHRLAILEAIADTRHAALGALTARVALTEAEVHLHLGDRAAASKALELARTTFGNTAERLHFGQFAGYGALLRRVAVEQEERERIGGAPRSGLSSQATQRPYGPEHT